MQGLDKFARELNMKKAVLDRGKNGRSVPFRDINLRERKRVYRKFKDSIYTICEKGKDTYCIDDKCLRKYNLVVWRRNQND